MNKLQELKKTLPETSPPKPVFQRPTRKVRITTKINCGCGFQFVVPNEPDAMKRQRMLMAQVTQHSSTEGHTCEIFTEIRPID